MVQHVSWRWLFYVMSIFAASLVILFALFLPETHAQTLLSRKAAQLRKTTEKPFYAEKDVSSMTIAARLKITTLRPAIMLCTQPVIQLAAFLMGYQFGLLYIVHATFANMWIERYGQSHTASGLHYFAIVTGSMAALLIEWWAMDAIWARLKARNAGVSRPENRVPLMIPGTLLLPAGLLLYGWAAEKHVHWAVVDVGKTIISNATDEEADVIARCRNAWVRVHLEHNCCAILHRGGIPGLYSVRSRGISASSQCLRLRFPNFRTKPV